MELSRKRRPSSTASFHDMAAFSRMLERRTDALQAEKERVPPPWLVHVIAGGHSGEGTRAEDNLQKQADIHVCTCMWKERYISLLYS